MLKTIAFIGSMLLASTATALEITPFNNYWDIGKSVYGNCAVLTSYGDGSLAFEMNNDQIVMYHYHDAGFRLNNLAVRVYMSFEPFGATLNYQMVHPSGQTTAGMANLDPTFLELAFNNEFMIYENSQTDFTIEINLEGFAEAMAIAYNCNK